MTLAPDPMTKQATLAFLADQTHFPLEVGTLAIDAASGHLRRNDPREPIKFGFSFAGHAFEAEGVERDGPIVFALTTTIGRLPYSVEDRQRRVDLARVLRALGGSSLKWEINRHQVVRVAARIQIAPPFTAVRIIAAAVELLLPDKSYLELLAEIARRPKVRAAQPDSLQIAPAAAD